MPQTVTLRVAAEQQDDGDEVDGHHWMPPLDRRRALRLLSLTAAAGVVGCGSGGTISTGTGTTSAMAAATTTTLTASSSSIATSTAITLTATVSPGAATGVVTFYSGTTSLGSAALSSGVATLSTSFGTAGAVSVTAAYAGSTAYATSTSAAVALTVTAGTACSSATLEGEEGPYFVDDSASGYFRMNILSNLDGTETQGGIPLALTLYVYDSQNSCAAMQGVQVDIWHCNASGLYSAENVENTAGKSWLRGYQITDASGKVSFSTIVPGWYQGRTTHIHLRLRSTYNASSSGGNNTMQLFFDQTLVDTIDTTVAPYSGEGKNTTTNASDRVYTQQEKGTTLMTPTGSNSTGYTATVKIYLPIKT